MARENISDEQWVVLEGLLPANKGRHGKDDRLFLNAVSWIIRTGAPWRDLPAEFGPWKTVYNRYHRWVGKGHFTAILERLKQGADNEWHTIDGTIIRAHKHAAGARKNSGDTGLGRSCGGFSSKIHAKVEGLGLPIKCMVTPGQSSDIGQANELVGEDKCDKLLADLGYDSDDFRDKHELRDCKENW